MNRQRLDSPLVYVGAHNVYYVKLPVKVLYFTIHIHTQINQYVVISDFPPVSVEKFNLCSVMFPVMQLLHSWVLLSPVMTIH